MVSTIPAGVKSRSKSRKKSGTFMIPAPKKPDGPPVAVEARCVRLLAKANDPASLAPVIERPTLSRAANEVLIEVRAAAVNPSDVKAATGLMAYAVFPRTPGRDYAGIVIDGPAGWIGREVFGSSGDLGIRRDGTHATHLAVEADVATRVRELTDGKGADIVFNTVGDPYFQAAHQSLAVRGRQILIAAINPIVPFNILEFYRGQHSYVGIDTLRLSSTATGAVLKELVPGFASGHLKPIPIKSSAIYPLEDAKAAFLAVAGSSRDRVILRPA